MEVTRHTSDPSPTVTTLSRRITMANSYIASAMSTGQHRARTCLSMCTVLSMCQKLKPRQIPWRQKVWSRNECQSARLLTVLLVRLLSELLAQVKDEQSYIVMRERTHRNTAESTNGRVKWWSIFQMIVLFAEGIFQVWWLKRFFEVGKNSTARNGVLSRY